MGRSFHPALLLALAAAAALGAYLLWPAATATVPDAATTEPTGVERDARLGLSATAGDARPAPPPGTDPRPEAPAPDALPTDIHEARLTVRLTGPDGAPIREGTVIALRRSEVVSRAALFDGAAYVAAPAVGGGAEPPVRLIVMPSGFAVMRVWAPVRAGTHRALDLKVPDGPVTSGVVADTAGRPVPNLRLLVVDAETPMLHVDSRSRDPALRAMQGGDGPVWATTRTDAAGVFTIRAAWAGERRIVSDDPAWFVEQGPTHLAGTASLRFVAVPGRSLALRALAADGSPWTAWCTWRLTVRDRGRRPLSLYAYGRDGATDVVWALGDPSAPCEVDVELETEGRRGTAFVSYAAGQARAAAEIRLAPADEALTGRLVAIVTDARGEPVDEPLNAALSDPRATNDAPRWLRLEREGPGRHVLKGIPAGRHAVRIEPFVLFSHLVSWTGEVDVPARGDAVARVTLPAFGALRVQGAFPAGTPYLSLTVERTDVASEPLNQASPTPQTRMLLPEGTWRVSLCDPPGKPKLTRELRISAAQEALADFTK